jgi:hypothetical protein
MKLPHPLSLALLVATAAPVRSQMMKPDFQTPDVNSTSRRRAATSANLSPRDYLHQVTAWYFAHEG